MSVFHWIADFAPLDDLPSVRRRAAALLGDERTGCLEARLMAAGRVCVLVCSGIDALRSAEGADSRGAVLDTTYYDGCVRRASHRAAERLEDGRSTAAALRELADAANRVLAQLPAIGMADGFRELIEDLLDIATFREDGDDLMVHRCLLAWHAVTEAYMRFCQGQATRRPGQDGRGASRYPKQDIKADVVSSLTGPILGHHQNVVPNCAFGAAGKPPGEAFAAYSENLCWMADWETAGRSDGDTIALVDKLLGPRWREDAPNRGASSPQKVRIAFRRNAIGEGLTRWIAQLDRADKDTSQAWLLHSGVLCEAADAVRKATIVCIGYGSFHCWSTPHEMSLDDYVLAACAMAGEMVRGWAVDHDTEADISEHNLLNWWCLDCAIHASEDVLSPRNAAGQRENWEMQLAWGTQTYFWFSPRHQGAARRIDNYCARLPQPPLQVPVERVPPECEPVQSGDSTAQIVRKLLALCGLRADVPEHEWTRLLATDPWDCQPRICPQCAFDGDRDQMFMISVGCTRLAALLPQEERRLLAHLLDTYGYRLFPAVQSRLLNLCHCVCQWSADVLAVGYQESGITCGQSPCRLTAAVPDAAVPDAADLDARLYPRGPLLDRMLQQARVEAETYTRNTGRGDWLAVVSRPLPSRTTHQQSADAPAP
ncbi:hypothetical protein [Sorangium sp. So ce1078]|uniref:hypothetical protein n=1 Tax=Sorangium sp. So ce1078 TaxID=3133329 RepID=UPI003F607D17